MKATRSVVMDKDRPVVGLGVDIAAPNLLPENLIRLAINVQSVNTETLESIDIQNAILLFRYEFW